MLDFIYIAISTKTGLSVTGYWSRSLTIYRSSPMIKFSETIISELGEIIEEASVTSVFIRFLKNMLDFLMAIRQMNDLYDSDEMIKSHKNIWDAMRAVQHEVV